MEEEDIGPALPPHIRQRMQASQSTQDAGGDDFEGPALPPHLRSQKREREEEREGDGNEDVCGPALPPHLRPNRQEKREEEDEECGPALPPHLRSGGEGTKTTGDDEGVCGPALPPHLHQKKSEGEKVVVGDVDDSEQCGPFIPPHIRQKLEGARRDDDDREECGPSLPPHLRGAGSANSGSVRGDSGRASAGQNKDEEEGGSKRNVGPSLPNAIEMKRAMLLARLEQLEAEEEGADEDIGPSLPGRGGRGGEDGGGRELSENEKWARVREGRSLRDEKKGGREEWMTALPERNRIDPVGFGLGKTKFRQRTMEKSEFENSMWTETPQQREERLKNQSADEEKQKREKAKQEIRHQLAMLDMPEKASSSRGPSLVEKHQREMFKEKKMEKEEKERRKQEKKSKKEREKEREEEILAKSWDWQRDMGTGGKKMSVKDRQSLVSKARDFSSRFSSGGYQKSFM